MSGRKYDPKTEIKLSKIYNDAISNYSSDNNDKKIQIKDLKATLEINQTLLYNFINSSEIEEEKISNLIKKNNTLWNNMEKLLENSRNIELKTIILQSFSEKIPIEINEELNILANKNYTRRKEIDEKDEIIKKLQKDLERARKNALFKEARTEVYVAEPTKKSIEKNKELLDARAILGKVTRKHSKTRNNANKLKRELNWLKKDLNELKDKIPELYYNNDYFKTKGYIYIDENNEEYEEEEDEKADSSDDENEVEKSKKKKEKEFKELKEKYDKLKKEYDECEKKINEYKKEYKLINKNIQNIKDNIF